MKSRTTILINRLKIETIFYFSLLGFLFSLTVISPIASPSFSASETIPIYYYCSESGINNVKFLKTEFDIFLSTQGSYEFYPYTDRETLENQIKNRKKYIIIVSGWHYQHIYKEYSLKPLLIGVRNGKTHHKRLLIGDRSATMETVKTGQIASAASIQQTRNELKSILNHSTDSLRILTVPRDIDALMSVGIGISPCAYASENSLEKLCSINPTIAKRMTTMAEGKPTLLLVVAVPDSYAKEAENILTIFEKMQSTSIETNKISLLGLDSWEKISSANRLKLDE